MKIASTILKESFSVIFASVNGNSIILWDFNMNSLPPFTELKYAETPKENKRRWRVGELCQETDTSNAHCFIRLWFDHPDRALWKRAKTIKLAVRLSLRAWNKAAILQWLQVLIHPSEVTKVKGQHIGESILLSVALNSRLHYQMDAEKSVKLFLNSSWYMKQVYI